MDPSRPDPAAHRVGCRGSGVHGPSGFRQAGACRAGRPRPGQGRPGRPGPARSSSDRYGPAGFEPAKFEGPRGGCGQGEGPWSPQAAFSWPAVLVAQCNKDVSFRNARSWTPYPSSRAMALVMAPDGGGARAGALAAPCRDRVPAGTPVKAYYRSRGAYFAPSPFRAVLPAVTGAATRDEEPIIISQLRAAGRTGRGWVTWVGQPNPTPAPPPLSFPPRVPALPPELQQRGAGAAAGASGSAA